jgi:hypothetical protein
MIYMPHRRLYMVQEVDNVQELGNSVSSETNALNANLKEEKLPKKDGFFYIYKILSKINNKVYIGQTVQPRKRWYQHKLESKKDEPNAIISRAIKKHGIENFEFEVIACCKNQDAANKAEEQIIDQYDCLIQNKKGYNVALGGYNAPKSKLWKQSMKNWRSSLSEEEKQIIRDKQSLATRKQIEERGHPAEGYKWTEEQMQRMEPIRLRISLQKDKIYTEEVRQRMSEAHIGKVQSREQIEKRIASIKLVKEKKYLAEDIRCHAEGCQVAGKAKYAILNNVRYCELHGSRIKRNGHLDLLPKKPVIMTEEIRNKISESRKGKGLGREPHNKVNLTQEQIQLILNDSRSIMELSKSINLGRKVISRIRKQFR